MLGRINTALWCSLTRADYTISNGLLILSTAIIAVQNHLTLHLVVTDSR